LHYPDGRAATDPFAAERSYPQAKDPVRIAHADSLVALTCEDVAASQDRLPFQGRAIEGPAILVIGRGTAEEIRHARVRMDQKPWRSTN
jgi:hypothetical protein